MTVFRGFQKIASGLSGCAPCLQKHGQRHGLLGIRCYSAGISDSIKTEEKVQNPKERFIGLYPKLKQLALNYAENNNLPQRQRTYLSNCLDYNVVGGKMNRGLTVASALQSLRGSKPLSEVDALSADVCGWSIELMQACFLVSDDIMDKSVTRRGQPCWYRVESVGMVAINDALVLDSLVYFYLKSYFENQATRLNLYELFHDIAFKTQLGQLTDLTTQVLGQPIDWTRYTMQTYETIVKYKTSYYTFYLPVASAMLIDNVQSPEAFKIAEKICLAMGEYFQIQDDYLDCYGDPSVIGKIGTDIEDGKCCWLVVKALSIANEEDQQTIKSHYGKNNPESTRVIKGIYEKLKIQQIFQDYEEACHKDINKMIASQDILPKAIFSDLMAKIFKRTK